MVDDRLKQLAGLYLLRTRDELTLMRAKLQQAQAGQADALLELQRIAHRISGSGAMLGFKAIGEHAGQIERILRNTNLHPADDDWQKILAQLQGIESELARATPDIDTDE
jgi:HPt (histidine-containing phosphotransfer) domain-containing protein